MFARLLALTAAALGFASTAAAGIISNCGTDNSLFKITDLALTPDVPVPGDIMTMSIGFDAPVSVSDGFATYTLSLNGLPFSQQDPLCKDTVCPIPAGHNVVTSNITIPSSVAGTISAKIAWTDAVGAELICVRIKETLTSKAVVTYDFVRPYSPHYLTVAEYANTLDSMYFFTDSFAPFPFVEAPGTNSTEAKRPVKKNLRGSMAFVGNSTTGTGTGTITGVTTTTTNTGGTTGTNTTTSSTTSTSV